MAVIQANIVNHHDDSEPKSQFLIPISRRRERIQRVSKFSSAHPFLMQMQSPVCLLDERLRPCAVNTPLAELLDVSEGRTIVRALSNWVHRTRVLEMVNSARRALKGHSTVSRFWAVLPSGEIRRYSITYIPLHLDSVEFDGVALLFSDITDDCETGLDEALHDSSYELGQGEWFWETDKDDRFTYVSPNFQFLSGEDHEFFIGKTRAEVLARFFQVDDLSELACTNIDISGFLELERLVRERKPIRSFVYPRLRNNTKLWISISGIPIFSTDGKNSFLGYRGIGRDISDLSDKFENYQTISNACDLLSVGMATVSSSGALNQFNQPFLDHLGLDSKDVRAGISLKEIDELTFGSTRKLSSVVTTNTDSVSTSSTKRRFEWEDGDGKWRSVESHHLSSGRSLVEIRDISDQKHSQSEVISQRQMLESLIESMPDAVFALDCDRRYIVANSATTRWSGCGESKDLLGRRPEDCFGELLSVDHLAEIKQEELEVLTEGRSILNREKRVKHNDDNIVFSVSKVPIRNADKEVIGLVCHAKDISYLHELTDQLAHQAEHDMLTGLINRRGFDHRVMSVVGDCKQLNRQAVVCFIDLDRFKVVNDSVGHQAGDDLLKQVSQLILQSVRESDIVARLGGDEFGLILQHCSIENALRQMHRLIEKISAYRFQWEDKLFEIGASIGLVKVDDEHTAHSLLSSADMACYSAKAMGRGRCHVYSDTDLVVAERQTGLELAAQIRKALDEDNFTLYKQPIAVTSSPGLDIHHYEVLLRMNGEDGEFISPAVFIPVAERFDLMVSIDRWVIDNALESYSLAFVESEQVIMTINLSGLSLSDPGMGDYVVDRILKRQVDPRSLCFEITETAFVSNLSQAQAFVSKVKALGSAFALDDFGSGLSSFAYLKNFEIDYLKIDGCFVRNIVEDSTDKAMVAAINVVGHTLGMLTVAEFVESEEHIDVLREIGVDYVQGYGIEAPTPLLASKTVDSTE